MRIKKKNTTKCHGCPTVAASNRIHAEYSLKTRQSNQSPLLADEDITTYKGLRQGY